MKMSTMFCQTLRTAPSEADFLGHKLLLRAGYIRQLGTGLFSFMTLGKRTKKKIEDIIRKEINSINGQEFEMPVVNPAEIWKQTNRWYEIGSEMARFCDRYGRDMVLAMTHEEAVVYFAKNEIHSYKQLPQLIYHIQTKFRDDPRPRAGLIRVREFTMADSYSLDRDWDGLDKQYKLHYQAYFNIFNRCGLPTIAIRSDVGMMGGKLAHEFMYLTPIGEDSILLCNNCGFSSNRQIATFIKISQSNEQPLSLEEVYTPNCKTISNLADYLRVPESQTIKAIFLVAEMVNNKNEDIEEFVIALVRGDMDLNETKLANVIKAKDLRPAKEEEIKAKGIEPGYGSPINIANVLVVADDLIPQLNNLIAGSNKADYHYRNVNFDRDIHADIVADIVAAKEGYGCPRCKQPLSLSRGVEVGNIFKLGTRYSDSVSAKYLDKDGQLKAIVMGSYGIGPGRILACIAEEYNDKNGLVMPISIAPFQVHLLCLSVKNAGQKELSDEAYDKLVSAGIEVLYDDLDERPGVKFADADLMGIPLRLVIGAESLSKGGFELKRRDGKGNWIIGREEIVKSVKNQITEMLQEIEMTVVPVKYAE